MDAIAPASPVSGRQTDAPRLLVVDDNPDNLEITALLLARQYDVVACSSATEALAAIERVNPHCVILDIGMAPVDGVGCLNAIRTIAKYATIPAIALTAFARNVEREEFLAAGFRAVVTKPILDEELEQVVEAALAHHTLDRSGSATP